MFQKFCHLPEFFLVCIEARNHRASWKYRQEERHGDEREIGSADRSGRNP
jgi:hypothetical protein